MAVGRARPCGALMYGNAVSVLPSHGRAVRQVEHALTLIDTCMLSISVSVVETERCYGVALNNFRLVKTSNHSKVVAVSLSDRPESVYVIVIQVCGFFVGLKEI